MQFNNIIIIKIIIIKTIQIKNSAVNKVFQIIRKLLDRGMSRANKSFICTKAIIF